MLSGAKNIHVQGLENPLLCLEVGEGEIENVPVCREAQATWRCLGCKREGGVDCQRKETCEPNADAVRVIDQAEAVSRVAGICRRRKDK